MKAGWEIKALGEVCIVKRGTTITKKQTIDGEVPVIGGGTKPTYFHNQPNRDANCITISGSGASAGYVNSWTIPIFASDCSTVETRQDTQLQRFVYYYLLSQQNYIYETLRSGAAQPHVYAKDIAALSFPIVRIEEQKRIVSILDEAFEGLDRARENAEANLKSASELFGRYLDVAFQSQLDFKNVPLENLVEVVSGYSFASGDFNEENPIKSIKITNVGVKEFIKTTTENLPATFAIDYKRFCIPTGSIVISLTRSIIAGGLKVALVPTEFSGALLNQRVAALKVPNDASLRDFLYFYMSSSAVLDYVQKSANTLMQPNLSINDLKRLPVPIPKEQKIGKFVDVAMKLSKQTSELQVHYTSKLQDISDLRQSLLQKAFAGELT